MNIKSYWGVTNLYLALAVAVTVFILWLPKSLLDWALFAVLASGLIVEGAVMTINTMKRRKWTPAVMILVIMRFGLGAYFCFAVGLAIWDDSRTWRSAHDWFVYSMRSLATIVVLAELFIIPYRIRTRRDANYDDPLVDPLIPLDAENPQPVG